MISALVVLGAMGCIRRAGFGTAEGRTIARSLGLTGGKLVLAAAGRTPSGGDAVATALAMPWRRLMLWAGSCRDNRH